jgi:hypothetical protein
VTSAPSRTTNDENGGRSAYPVPVDELAKRARQLVSDGALPSQRKLMSELHIGMPKARAVLEALRAEEAGPAGAVRLHLVDSAEAAESESGGPTEPPAEPGEATEPGPAPDPVAAVGSDASELDQPTTESPTMPSASAPVSRVVDPVPESEDEATAAEAGKTPRHVPVWPVLLLTLPAFAAVWSGWVSLGGMAGFGVVHPLPGIADHVALNTAITLPIGVEVYAAYALWVWLSGGVPELARRFARASAVASLCTGALGQVAYHLLAAAHVQHAPWPITTLVACLPVAVLGMGAALAHLVRSK